MLVMNKVLITGTDDGDIVLWKADMFRKQGHESMVTCLARDKTSGGNLFYSGGKDGYLVIWAMEPNTLIMNKKISIINTLTPL
jgi:WD40 repeat protein